MSSVSGSNFSNEIANSSLTKATGKKLKRRSLSAGFKFSVSRASWISSGAVELAKSSAEKVETLASLFLLNMLQTNESYLLVQNHEFLRNKHFKEDVCPIPLHILKCLIHALSSSTELTQCAIFSIDSRQWQLQQPYLACQMDEQLSANSGAALSPSLIEANQKALDYETLQKSTELFEAVLQNIDRFSTSDSFEVMNLYRSLKASPWGKNHCNTKPDLVPQLDGIFEKCAKLLAIEWKEISGDSFRVIPAKEFIWAVKYSGRSKFSIKCPKTKSYFRLMDNMSAFCRSEILCFSEQGVTPLRRAQKIENLIFLAYSSYLMGSYMVSMAIYIGITHRSIERLSETWKLLGKESHDQWCMLCEKLEHRLNFEKLRIDMNAFKGRKIPFLTLYHRKFIGLVTTIECSEDEIKLQKFEKEIVEARIQGFAAIKDLKSKKIKLEEIMLIDASQLSLVKNKLEERLNKLMPQSDKMINHSSEEDIARKIRQISRIQVKLRAFDKMIFHNYRIKSTRTALENKLIHLKETRDKIRTMNRGKASSEEATVRETSQIEDIDKKLKIMEMVNTLDYEALTVKLREIEFKISQNSIKIVQSYTQIKAIKNELIAYQEQISTSPRINEVQKLTLTILDWHSTRSDQEFEEECYRLSSLYETSPRKDDNAQS